MARTGKGMGGLAVATVIAKNYLPFARVLAESFLRHHPGIPFFVMLADRLDDYFAPECEAFRLLTLDDAGIPNLPRFCFLNNRQGVVSGAKPYLLSYLLKHGFSSVVFLDADILVLNGIEPLLAEVRRHAVTLTPHFVSPLADSRRTERELTALRCGTYNGGFVGVSDTPATRRFLDWWQVRHLEYCRHSLADGMHYDQRWLDFAPSFIEDVHIVRDPRYNVAYWNLPERELLIDSTRVLVDGHPCGFFHFSGFEPSQPDAVTRYYPNIRMADIGPASEIFRRYVDLLNQAGNQLAAAWPYAYGFFDNGVPIPELARRMYRELGKDAGRFGDPFETHAETSFFHWLLEPVGDAPDHEHAVTRLWQTVYSHRPDLRLAYPDIHGADGEAFLRWIVSFGANEYFTSEHFLPSVGRLSS